MPTSGRFGSPQHVVVWTKGSTPLTARLFTPVLVAMDGSLNVVAPDMPWYLRALQTSRPLHFGDYGGLPLKILWALLDVIAIVVLVSGIYLWFAKRSSGRKPRQFAMPVGVPVAAHPRYRRDDRSAKAGQFGARYILDAFADRDHQHSRARVGPAWRWHLGCRFLVYAWLPCRNSRLFRLQRALTTSIAQC